MTPSKKAYYATVAQNYKASLLLNGCKAVIHLEDKNDIIFWNKIFKEACPQYNFYFIPYSRSQSGNKATGSSTCLIFKDFLDSKMAIAIDSDLHYLMQEPYIDAKHYILQTYTYSFENHLCFTDRLAALPILTCGFTNSIFDFNKFLLAYSKEIYPLFLLFLYDHRQKERKLPNTDFFKLLSFPYSNNRIDDNGDYIITTLHKRVTPQISYLKSIYPNYDEAVEKAKYKRLGLTEENTYLYIRGHNLYDLITKLGEEICNILKRNEKKRLSEAGEYDKIATIYQRKDTFKKKLLNADLYFTYPEIKRCVQDIRSIWP